jgi:hypothetical protein
MDLRFAARQAARAQSARAQMRLLAREELPHTRAGIAGFGIGSWLYKPGMGADAIGAHARAIGRGLRQRRGRRAIDHGGRGSNRLILGRGDSLRAMTGVHPSTAVGST